MIKNFLSIIISVQLVFLSPLNTSAPKYKIELAAQSGEEDPLSLDFDEGESGLDSDTDELRAAFQSLQSFAEKTGSRTAVEDPLDTEEEISLEDIEKTIEASEKIGGELGDFSVEEFKDVVHDFSQIKLDELPYISESVFTSTASTFLLGGIRKNARSLIGRILSRLYPELDLGGIRIDLNGLLVPRVTAEFGQDYSQRDRYNRDRLKSINISAGAIAFSRTIDELAAQIASAVSASNPKVYGFKDDERFYRVLEEKGNALAKFRPDEQKRIKQDLAALERVIDAEFRAEALTRFEIRIYNQFVNQFGKKKIRYFLTRKMAGKANIDGFDDEYYESRIQVQRAYLGYIQQHKSTLKSFQAVNPFKGKDWRFRLRMKAYVMPFFSSKLHWFGPVAAMTLPHYIKVGWLATTAYFGFHFGHFRQVMGEDDITKIFEPIVTESEKPEWLVELVHPFVQFGNGVSDVASSAWYGAGDVLSAMWSFNSDVLDPWVWSPIGSFLSSAWDVVTSGAGAAADGVGAAADYSTTKLGQGLDIVLPDTEEQHEGGFTGDLEKDSGSQADASAGYDKLTDLGSDYSLEIVLSVVALTIAYSVYKKPQAYKNAAISVYTKSKSFFKAIGRGSVKFGNWSYRQARWLTGGAIDIVASPYVIFNEIRRDFQSLELNKFSDLKHDEYKNLLIYLKLANYQERVRLDLPPQLKRPVEDNFRWVSRMLFFQVLDHWIVNLRKDRFSKKQIIDMLGILFQGSSAEYYALFKRKSMQKRLLAIMDYLHENKYGDREYPTEFKGDSLNGFQSKLDKFFDLSETINTMEDDQEAEKKTPGLSKYMKNAYVLSYAKKMAQEKNIMSFISAMWYFQGINNLTSGYSPFKKLYLYLFGKNLKKMTDLVFSNAIPEESREAYAVMYSKILNSTAHYKYSNISKSERYQSGKVFSPEKSSRFITTQEIKLAVHSVKRFFKSRGSVAAEVSRQGSIKHDSIYSPFKGTIKSLKKFLVSKAYVRRNIRKKKNIKEIVDWVQEHLISNNAQVTEFSHIFYEEIVRRPDLISAKEDLNLLFEHDYFWLQLPMDDSNVSQLESYLVKQLREKAKKNGEIWKYSPAQAEVVHGIIMKKVHELDAMPTSFRGKLDLWLQMTSKGITSETDRLFWSVVAEAKTKQQNDLLEKYALEEGRIWEASIAATLSIGKVKQSEIYNKLLNHEANEDRISVLEEVIELVKTNMPDRGLQYAEFLESISVDIRSTSHEAILIDQAKKDPGKFKNADTDSEMNEAFDENVLLMKSIFNDLNTWSVPQVIDFVMYLRGAQPASKKVRNTFKIVGPERVKRIFETLPISGRWGLLDALFTHVLFNREEAQTGFYDYTKRKILGDAESQLAATLIKGSRKTFLEKFVPSRLTKSQQVSYKVLEAFLYAMEKTGNGVLTSYIFSYLFALPPSSQSSPGETLKNILEVLGTLFVKFGQILSVTKKLPPEENIHLEGLRENANIPNRVDVYHDLASIYNVKPHEIPIVLKDIIAGASVKYAALGFDKERDLEVVLKIFRSSAINNRKTQYAILDFMSERLIEKGGSEFLIFETLVDAAKQAVEDEVDAEGEGKKSRLARKTIYANRSTNDVIVEVPFETNVNDRLVVSAFAREMSFDDMKKVNPVVARKLAKVILTIETDILFGSDETVFLFEPDRHGGNYRVHYEIVDGKVRVYLRPIDMGQLSKISDDIRDKIIRLFALSQILYQVGPNEGLIQTIVDLFELNKKQRKILSKTLRKMFPDNKLDQETAYFSVLSAISQTLPPKFDENGNKIKQTLHRTYVDFVRAILQTSQYELEGLPKTQMSPAKYFKNSVIVRLQEYSKLIKLSGSQERKIKAFNLKNRLTKGGDYEPLPVDLEALILKNAKIDEEFLSYRFGDKEDYGEVLTSRDIRQGESEIKEKFSCSHFLSLKEGAF